MLSKANNEQLVRVGPGTDMGRVMRCYWHPVALSTELPSPDCAPIRIKLLGERFVMFRDSKGIVGMLDELCPHRGASLAIGRVEEGGIRCLYHGWKFTTDGTVLETPNHADCGIRDRFKATAYPVVEEGGMIWTYIGDPDRKPPFRRFAAAEVPPENRVCYRVTLPANYLQVWEGGLDSSHVSTLHTNQARPSWGASRGKVDVAHFRDLDDTAPLFEVEDTSFGYHYAAIRGAGGVSDDESDIRNVRIVPAILPSGRIIPGPGVQFLVWETPDDDEQTSTFTSVYSDHPIDKDWLYDMLGLNDSRFWTEDDTIFKGSWDNHFLQARDNMYSNWTGLKGIVLEDAMMAISPGPIYDRSGEHLVAADLAVVRIRRRLKDAIKMVQAGEAPPAVMIEDMRAVASVDVDVSRSADWRAIAGFHQTLEPATAG